MFVASDTAWEWPCNIGIAEWYADHEKPQHAIAVYEHLLKQIQRKGLEGSESEYCGAFQPWLQQLFELSLRQGFTERAQYIAELIGDFHNEGFFEPSDYAEVVANVSALRHPDIRSLFDKERAG